jgi:hypothetical protein
MIKEANKKYVNVSIEALELFKELCEECQQKERKLASKGLVVKPIVSKEEKYPKSASLHFLISMAAEQQILVNHDVPIIIIG